MKEREDMTPIEEAVAQEMESCDKCGKTLSKDYYEKTVFAEGEQYTIHYMTKVLRMYSRRRSNGDCVGHNLIEHNLCSVCYNKFCEWIKQK